MGAEKTLRPELVFGLVGALGTDLKIVEKALEHALLQVGYKHATIRVSEAINSVYNDLGLPILDDAETPIDLLMDQGDTLRRHRGDGDAAAAIAIAAISKQRFEALQADPEASDERDSTATIVNQLKHPDEVRLLRSVYGPRFILIGAWSPKGERTASTEKRLRTIVPSQDQSWYEQQVPRLMSRDEKDGTNRLGQRVRDTFELADAYVALRTGYSIQEEVARIIRLLFGAPFETPTRHEQAMFQAFGARLRSSAGGRQVGAVVIDNDGELLASGTNDVPKAGGGQYWTGDEPDNRDFRNGADFNDQEKIQIISDLVDRLKSSEGWLSDEMSTKTPRELAELAMASGGPFNKSRIGDLLEFGRILHAEMSVICTAARRGTSLARTTMYTTTYPCHECARLIIGSGISRVVYVDPYPKSLVPRMYRTEVVEGQSDDGVIFEAFAGVAPRMFPSVFAMIGRNREELTGEYVTWAPSESRPRLVDASVLRFPVQMAEDEVTKELLTSFDVGDDGETTSSG